MKKTALLILSISTFTNLCAAKEMQHGPGCSCSVCSIPLTETEKKAAANISLDTDQKECIVVPPCEVCCDPCDACNDCCFDCVIERVQTFDEAYPPPYGNIDCFWGLFVDVSFLYWYGNESNLTYAYKTKTVSSGIAPSTSTFVAGFVTASEGKNLDTKWDPGVRIGVGWNGNCSGWDAYVAWTYYCNKSTETTSESFDTPAPKIGECGLLSPWSSPLAAKAVFLNTLIFDSVSASWRFHINQLDLQMGKRYFLDPCFTLRSFLGIRSAWTRTNFDVIASRSPYTVGLNTVDASVSDDFKSCFWGVGLLAGFQPNWYFTDCISLYGDFDGALLWGKKEFEKKETGFQKTVSSGTITIDLDYSAKYENEYFFMQPVLDLGIGLRYETTLCCNRYQLSIDAGWEHHIWWDHNIRFKQYDEGSAAISGNELAQVATTYDETSHNIQFGGFVLRARFDY